MDPVSMFLMSTPKHASRRSETPPRSHSKVLFRQESDSKAGNPNRKGRSASGLDFFPDHPEKDIPIRQTPGRTPKQTPQKSSTLAQSPLKRGRGGLFDDFEPSVGTPSKRNRDIVKADEESDTMGYDLSFRQTPRRTPMHTPIKSSNLAQSPLKRVREGESSCKFFGDDFDEPLTTPSKRNRDAEHCLASSPDTARKEDEELLTRLFCSIESTLGIFERRRTRGVITKVRQAVEAETSRDLSEERIRKITGTAGDMFRLEWIRGELEIAQRCEDGRVRVPDMPERNARKERFVEAIRAGIVSAPFPERPGSACAASPAARSTSALFSSPTRSPGSDCVLAASPAIRLENMFHEALASPSPAKTPESTKSVTKSAKDRLSDLRDRVRMKEAMRRAAETYTDRITDLRNEIATCENAMVVQNILCPLFSRGGTYNDEFFDRSKLDDLFKNGTGSQGMATEAEVLDIVTERKGPKTCNPMEYKAARKAVAFLSENNGGWFDRSESTLSKTALSFLTRTPTGTPGQAMDALKKKHKALTAQLDGMDDEVRIAADEIMKTLHDQESLNPADHAATVFASPSNRKVLPRSSTMPDKVLANASPVKSSEVCFAPVSGCSTPMATRKSLPEFAVSPLSASPRRRIFGKQGKPSMPALNLSLRMANE